MSIPTLPDVKAQLGISGSAQDSLLSMYLKAALRLVENRVGPSSVQEFTETVSTHSNSILLSKRPITEIVSITAKLDTWPTFAASEVAFDAKAGVLYHKDLGTMAGAYDITYNAGWDTWPENWQIAVMVTVQHMWRTQRGSSRRPSQGGTDELGTRAGTPYALPPLAQELTSDGIYYGGIA